MKPLKASNNCNPQKRLSDMMAEKSENSIDIYYTIYQEFFLHAENPSDLLKQVIEFPGSVGDDSLAPQKISQQTVSETIKQYQSFLTSSVDLLIKQNLPIDLFYDNLWKVIFCSPTSPKDAESCSIILEFLKNSPLLPYFQAIDLLEMENNEFTSRLGKLRPRIAEAIHMLNRHFSQKTQESSQIYRLAQSLSFEDACVYWAAIISIVRESSFASGCRQSSEEDDVSKHISE